MDRAEHPVRMRLQLLAVRLDEAAEGVLAAASRRLEQPCCLRVAHRGYRASPKAGSAVTSGASAAACGRSGASTATATTIATPMSTAAMANARW